LGWEATTKFNELVIKMMANELKLWKKEY
jgi:GDP-D-mannose dehydratase